MTQQKSSSAPFPPELVEWRETVLAHGDDMGRSVVEFDWGRTPLGPLDIWPPALRAATAVCVTSRFPVVLLCGPDLRMIYNDGYRPMLGQVKHPGALGERIPVVWAEV